MNTNFNHELQQLQMELRAQNFDIIRFSTYRTACKLRFIQKKLHFHHLDLPNVIEALRESYTTLLSHQHSTTTTTTTNPPLSLINLQTFLTSIYTNLNKRLPFSQQILHIDNYVHSAIAWFLYVYKNSIRFNSFRVVLILLCTGKLIDKMRHLFTVYLSISSSTLTYQQIDELLHEILALPYALQEISYATYKKNYTQLIFSHLSSPISLNHFLELLIYNNSSHNCLQWLIIFHRLISVENIIHRVKCSGCQRPSFSGFRYKCLECHQGVYQLCQDCFWRGRTSEQHLSTHEMKEYTYFVSPNKHFRHSLRKTLQCVPKRNQLSSSLTIDQEQKLLEDVNRSDTPKLNHNLELNDDEHKEIASYTNRLSSITGSPSFNPAGIQRQRRLQQAQRDYVDQRRAEKKLTIARLEAENRRIHHEINTLRAKLKYQSADHLVPEDIDDEDDDISDNIDILSPIERQYTSTLPNRDSLYHYNDFHQMRRANSVETTNKNPYFEHELQLLVNRKHQLESRIRQLQKSRDELTSQLDNLGQILHSSPYVQHRSMTSSPYNHASFSPKPRPVQNPSIRSYSTPATPVHKRLTTNYLRTDLLQAADSLTSAMSSLVHQLNTDESNSLLTVIKSGNKYNFYPYDIDHRTDEESFFVSDDYNDDDFLKSTDDDDDNDDDDQIFNLSSIKQNIPNYLIN